MFYIRLCINILEAHRVLPIKREAPTRFIHPEYDTFTRKTSSLLVRALISLRLVMLIICVFTRLGHFFSSHLPLFLSLIYNLRQRVYVNPASSHAPALLNRVESRERGREHYEATHENYFRRTISEYLNYVRTLFLVCRFLSKLFTTLSNAYLFRKTFARDPKLKFVLCVRWGIFISNQMRINDTFLRRSVEFVRLIENRATI